MIFAITLLLSLLVIWILSKTTRIMTHRQFRLALALGILYAPIMVWLQGILLGGGKGLPADPFADSSFLPAMLAVWFTVIACALSNVLAANSEYRGFFADTPWLSRQGRQYE